MAKRMKNMWIEPVRLKSMPSSGASDARPINPANRVHGVDATAHRSQTTAPFDVRS